MFKKKCSLCGGRLENNRCTLCGLDNSIYEQRRPVRQSTMEPAHRVQTPRPNPSSASSSGTKSASQKKQAQHMPRQPGSIQPPRRIQVQNMQPQDKKSKYSSRIVLLTIVITVSLIVLSFILSLQNEDDDHIWSDEGYVWSDEYDTYDYSDYDPYEYVTREIPETGETYETVLGNGIYRIGVHVPEGIYRAELSEGTGSIQIKDEENGIYHYVTFGTDTEYDQVTEEEDIRLYNGADLLVDSGVILRFVTENAQPPVQEIQENPLKEAAMLLQYPGTIWMFSPQNKLTPVPSANSQYRKGRRRLIEYNQFLSEGSRIFYKSPQDLAYFTKITASTLWKNNLNIENHIREYSQSILNNKADDLFYYTQGHAYAYYLIMRGLAQDYKEIIVKNEIYEDWIKAIKYLESASRLNPTIVRNGVLDSSFTPNHLASISYYTTRAAYVIKTISFKLKNLSVQGQ